MFQNQEAVIVRRGRGRPQTRTDDDTRRVIVDAAARAFHSQGYAAASVAEVAQAAGVSTKTLYRLIPTKAALFESVVADRIDRFVLEVDHEVCATCDADVVLEALLTSYGRFALEPGTVAINQLVLAEGASFPELTAYFYEKAVRRTTAAMAGVLSRLRERGLVDIENIEEATQTLRGMMAYETQRAMMFGVRQAPSDAEIKGRARQCAELFLRGCAVKAAPEKQPGE